MKPSLPPSQPTIFSRVINFVREAPGLTFIGLCLLIYLIVFNYLAYKAQPIKTDVALVAVAPDGTPLWAYQLPSGQYIYFSGHEALEGRKK